MAKSKKGQKPWRDAVRDAMYAAALSEAGGKTTAFLYRWEHVVSVVETARKLGRAVGADLDVVEAAAWLHDVRKDAGDRHPQEGAKTARKLLKKTDFSNKKIETVAQAIEDHMGLWREKPLKSLESQVLWDADKLTKIGVLAAMHKLGQGLSRGKITSTEQLLDLLHSADYRARTVASMHTAPARKAAKKRFKAFDKLAVALDKEYHVTDIG